MKDYLIEVVLKSLLPRLVAVLVAVGVAHTQMLQSLGITVDWNTFGGKVTTGLVVLVGLLAAHHVDSAVKGVGQ